jgi:hypothetical protein
LSLTAAVLIVVGAMVGFGVFTALVSRRSPEGSLADRTPTSIYAVTSGAISLLIAFTFSMAFSQYTNAENATHAEAAAILQMYRATAFMQEPLGSELRHDLLCYAQLVVDDEWQQLDGGQAKVNDKVQRTLGAMDRAVSSPNGVSMAGSAVSIWETGNTNLVTARQERFAVADWSVPPLVYLMIILGSLITIGSLFIYADRTKPGWGHAVMIVGPVFVFVAGLMVIIFLDNPFTDTPGGVQPGAIRMTIEYIERDLGMPDRISHPSCPSDIDGSKVFPDA